MPKNVRTALALLAVALAGCHARWNPLASPPGYSMSHNSEDGVLGKKMDATLSDEDKMFLGELWQTYQAYSASKLWQMTHAEAPWENARNGCPPGERSTNEITQDSLKAYFATLAN